MSPLGHVLSLLGIVPRPRQDASRAAADVSDVSRVSEVIESVVVSQPKPPRPQHIVELVSDDFTSFPVYADTAAFIDWRFAQFPETTGISWSHLWNSYHEFCMLYRCRPLTVRKLQQQLSPHGVKKRRGPMNGKSRPTIYDLPACPSVQRMVA